MHIYNRQQWQTCTIVFRRLLSAQKLARKPTKVEHKQLAIKQDATYLIICSDCLQ